MVVDPRPTRGGGRLRLGGYAALSSNRTRGDRRHGFCRVHSSGSARLTAVEGSDIVYYALDQRHYVVGPTPFDQSHSRAILAPLDHLRQRHHGSTPWLTVVDRSGSALSDPTAHLARRRLRSSWRGSERSGRRGNCHRHDDQTKKLVTTRHAGRAHGAPLLGRTAGPDERRERFGRIEHVA